jgi:hypothetical protein
MSAKQGIVLLVIAALIAVATAFAHLSCIYFGPQCYSAQMAPSSIVESAKENTLLAPLATIFVSAIFILLASCALSGARLIRRLPLLNYGIYTIAFLSIVRGILPLQLWLRHPDKVTEIVLFVGIVWLAVGLCYLFGYKAVNGKRIGMSGNA